MASRPDQSIRLSLSEARRSGLTRQGAYRADHRSWLETKEKSGPVRHLVGDDVAVEIPPVSSLYSIYVRQTRSSERRADLCRMPYEDYLASVHWSVTRRLMLAHAKCRCNKCPRRKQLEVHHLHYRTKGKEGVQDLLVLCEKCHSSAHEETPRGRKTAPALVIIRRRPELVTPICPDRPVPGTAALQLRMDSES